MAVGEVLIGALFAMLVVTNWPSATDMASAIDCGCFETVDGHCSSAPLPDLTLCASTDGGGIHQCLAGKCLPNQCWGRHARHFMLNGKETPVSIPLEDFAPCLDHGFCIDHVCKSPSMYRNYANDRDEISTDILSPTRLTILAGRHHHHEDEHPMHLGHPLYVEGCVAHTQPAYEGAPSWFRARADGLACGDGSGECFGGTCFRTNISAPLCPQCVTISTCAVGECQVMDMLSGEEQQPGCVGNLPPHAEL